MARVMTMPVNKYKEQVTSKSSGGNIKVFKPLPNVGGEKYDNNIFVSLMSPETWKLFSPDDQMVNKYSMNTNFKLSDPNGGSLNTFFMPIPMHWVENAVRSDGSVGGQYVVCPNKLNDQLRTLLGCNPLFLEDRCACCEKEAEFWKIFNDSWESSGYSKDSFKGNTSGYMDVISNNPVMKQAREQAKSFKANDRYIINVFDLNKFWGTRPLDEGEDNVAFQAWFAPKQIFETLYDIHNTYAENDIPNFYDITSEGVLPIVVTRDNTKCTGRDLRNTNYSVKALPMRKAVDVNWAEYLDNPAAMVDPTDLFGIMTYEEMRSTLEDNNEEDPSISKRANSMPPISRSPQSTPPVSPAQRPVSTHSPVAPPTAPQATQQSRPAQAPTPPVAPPVAPPTASNPTPPIPSVAKNEVPEFVPGLDGDVW